jgi:hypothetical protein
MERVKDLSLRNRIMKRSQEVACFQRMLSVQGNTRALGVPLGSTADAETNPKHLSVFPS